MVALSEVLACLERRYPADTAEPWDAVGLVCGDPDAPVSSVLLAVDPTPAVARDAVAAGADLLLTHHPLFLRGTHAVATTTAGGRVVSALVGAGVALHTVHTNADVARPGVSDALTARLGVVDTRPLQPRDGAAPDVLAVLVPLADEQRVTDALHDAGAGALGDYERCAWRVEGTGSFLPGDAATPALGRRGRLETVAEARVEVLVPTGRRAAVLAALRAAHPYEEPAFAVLPTAALPDGTGLGRVGRLAEPTTVADLARRAAAALPVAAAGVRASGDPSRPVRTVAVCGGSGDSLLGAARAAGVDAYVTADLRHHPARDVVDADGPALLDVGHEASEHPWLSVVAGELEADCGVSTTVSTRRTDPWTAHAPGCSGREQGERPDEGEGD